MSASPRWLRPRVLRAAALPVRPALSFASFFLIALTASCATARRLVSPAPLMAPETVEAMTAWVQSTDSLQDLRFASDAAVITPKGEIDGGLAAESFANGTLEGAHYTSVALTIKKVFVCDDQVVIVEGDYGALATDSGVPYPVEGPLLIRTIIDAQGVPHANLVRLSTTRGIRTGALARGCNEAVAYRFASRPRGITVFGLGLPLTTAQSDAIAEMKYADWYCPTPTTCEGRHKSQSAGPFIEAYDRLRPGYGVQLLAGRFWTVAPRGYRIGNHPSRSGPLILHNTVDGLGATLYVERRNLRLAAGPALLRSSWFFNADIPKADSLGFNARTSAWTPALVGSATLMLPIGGRIDLEVTAFGDLAGSATPPSLLEFQPDAINTSAVALAIGLGLRL
jgi:hypothetical protein